MGQTAQQRIINVVGPTLPGQISTLTTTQNFVGGAGFGMTVITYYKVGKLYFGFAGLTIGGVQLFFGSGDGGQHSVPVAQASADKLATYLGVTVNTYYIQNTYGGQMAFWDGAVWQGTPPGNSERYTLFGFLAN